jgi:arylsulfatase A-like enzyme/Flp pilus assembly protein TadD
MGRRRRHPEGQTPSPAAPRTAGRRRLAIALVALAAAVVAGLAAWALRGPRTTVRRDPGLSVLLITIDTLRADALGAYGRADAETPWIDRLARSGVRFERAHAHNVITLPSHANILSGQYPFGHGVRDNSGFRFPPGTATLATILKARRYRTGAFVSAFPLDSRFGLDNGFEVYDDRLGGAETTQTAFLVPERRGSETVASALRWLGEHRGERVFCWVHLYEPHFPYEPPEPFASRFRAQPYQGEVAAADAALEPLLRPLLEAGGGGRTLVVLTGDHGESLGDHGELTHGIFAYESTLHVPLVIFAPSILAPAVVPAPVRHVDVLPTVLDALGETVPPNLPGRSLLALSAQGAAAATRTAYFEALSSSFNQGWAPLRGLIDGSLKYVDLPLPELYDLEVDPGEARNLAATRTTDLERLRGLLGVQRTQDRGAARIQEDPATLEKLHALGYTAGGAAEKARYTEDDDPKRLIDVDTRNREVIRLYRAGDIEGALAVCRENIQRRPGMPMAYLHLAFLERARGNLGAAVDAARKAFEMRPLDAESVSLYAVYLIEAGRSREAADVLEPYMSAVKPDLDLLTARGMALTNLGRPQEALATFQRARETDPSNPVVLVNVGAVYLGTGDRTRARQALEAALDIDPGVARAHNMLGVIAAQEGRPEEAIERWRRGVALDPGDYQTLFNLGVTLRKQGRESEARPFLEAYLRVAPRALEARDIVRVREWLGHAPASGR